MSVARYNSASEFEYGELNFGRRREVRPRRSALRARARASYRDAINRDREPRRRKVKLLALDYIRSIIICVSEREEDRISPNTLVDMCFGRTAGKKSLSTGRNGMGNLNHADVCVCVNIYKSG